MAVISLTDFADFIGKKDGPRRTHVRRWASRGLYDPTTDYWLRLRTGIIRVHKKDADLAELDALAASVSDKKVSNYTTLVANYKRWAGRVGADWFEPTKGMWRASGLDFAVNPELGLEWGGRPRLVKLYFKKPELEAESAAVIMQLMAEKCLSGLPDGVRLAVLDIRRCKLFEASGQTDALAKRARAEAAAWKRLMTEI